VGGLPSLLIPAFHAESLLLSIALRLTAVTASATSTLEIIRAGTLDYETALAQQRRIADEVIAGTNPGTVLLLEHPPVFTAGRRTEAHERPFDGTPVIDVDRGGKITWHGPGQLVGYPIIRLPDPMNVVSYVRKLEDILMVACADLGVGTIKICGRSGVWLEAEGSKPQRKIAAIGVRVAQGVTTHGFAINANPDLTWYDRIVPCGIADAGVTSLSKELGRDVTVEELLPIVERRIHEMLP
jgi:lipoyl(octanoyl) transferase